MSTHQKGVFFALTSGVLYGFLGYFGISIINAGMSLPAMLFWRFLIASLFMLPLIIFNNRSIRSEAKNCFISVLLGLIFYSASALLYFASSLYIGTGFAMVMYFCYPIYVLLINIIVYKTKVSRLLLLSILLLSIGMILLIDLTESHLNIIGMIIGMMAALAYSIYIVGSKNIDLPSDLSTFTVSAGSALACLLVALMDNNFYYPENMKIWIDLAGISIICTALPILALLQSLKYISSEKASILSTTEPLFVVIVGIIFLGEKISTIQTLGVIFALFGALTATFSNGSDNHKPALNEIKQI